MSAFRIPQLPRRAAKRGSQAGLGLIEMLIAVLISTAMMAGLLTIVYGTRQNFTAQYQLAQLQDNERMAMSLVSTVIQNGGYFYNPSTQAPTAAFPVTTAAPIFASGQFIQGNKAGSTTNYSDQIYARYLIGPNNTTAASDGTTDCTGATNPSTSASEMSLNYLYVNTSTKQLICQATDGASAAVTTVLATNVTNMTINYGVAASVGGTSVVQYVPSASMIATPALFSNVVSVQVTLTFTPPPASAGANMFPTMSVSLTRVIDLLNRV